MEFRIADTFTDSLARLASDEQKAVKTTAFDLQVNPMSPGHSFHKLDRAKDKQFWSVRASRDIRLIVHRTDESLLLCYVDHHDKAYSWAERRKLETHPRTGAAQLVEIRETVKEVVVPQYVEAKPKEAKPTVSRLFVGVTDEEFLNYGVPSEWLADARAATDDSLLILADHLPAEAAEALLELATGGKPVPATPATPTVKPFEHPDAQRRFRVMTDVDELKQALDAPWDKWTIFLHPSQRQMVEREYRGPVRVSGTAGTGKTIVALHHAAFVARKHPEARVLLTTFSPTLASALRQRLTRLIAHEPRLGERIDVFDIETIAARLYQMHIGKPLVADAEMVRATLTDAARNVKGHKFSDAFIRAEWSDIVDAWQHGSWEEYRDASRTGRKTRISEPQRKTLWSIFEQARETLAAKKLITPAAMMTQLAAKLAKLPKSPFEFVVADECQDVSVCHLRFLVALTRGNPGGLYFTGDLGQRIFQPPFSWKSLGVDLRGRSRTLKVNYRTSHQIRQQADRLLGPEIGDADGNVEDRRQTVSVFNGPLPTVQAFKDQAGEQQGVADWIQECRKVEVPPQEIGVFVRSDGELARAKAAVKASGETTQVLDANVESKTGRIAIGTMHLAKGLEYRAVVVMACDDEILPQQARIEAVGDESELDEVYATERHLLYVACTRARERLLVTATEPMSEFLEDIALPSAVPSQSQKNSR